MVNQTFQRKNLYKDFDLSMAVNPLTGDIGVKTDAAAINQSLKNLINTNFYERPFRPNIGTNLQRLLFEPADVITINELRYGIFETINNYEPRVELIEVDIEDYSERNAYRITIIYRINLQKEPVNFTYTLKRLK